VEGGAAASFDSPADRAAKGGHRNRNLAQRIDG
jgi:hypothetical protein